MPARPRIAITPGEPAGIGPDLCVLLAQRLALAAEIAPAAELAPAAEILVFADPDLLQQRAQQLGLALQIQLTEPDTRELPDFPGLWVVPEALSAKAEPGILNPANAVYNLRCLDHAIAACQAGACQALVTGPLHKGVINQAGIEFTGHTEYLARQCQSPMPVMMLQSPQLRVALATTHLPLKEVSGAITRQRLSQVIEVLHRDLSRYLARPARIYVSGLNPHAGEGGYLGREELDIIEPVLAQYRQQGMDLTGPLAADTMFSEENREQADVFLCMYHDQGLPVLKYQGFGSAVNITLGLPFLRCSVDHGTALALAGSGAIDSGSMRYALRTAIDFVTAERAHG